MSLLVTGAAGFIGSSLVRHLRRRWPERKVISFDALTYCGRRENLAELDGDPLHVFVRGDVADAEAVEAVFAEHDVDGVLHLAAESHVDRSILDPLAFVRTNVVGTVTMLRAASRAWAGRTDVRFVHVSTDEVFGSLGAQGLFDEDTRYDPRSPYSASKASADHMARAWHHTYGLPVIVTNCSNNYGPWQFPEKLIPVVIRRALAGEPVPIYGKGENVRDWLYVEDHCDALATVYERGQVGRTYCIGGDCEQSNLQLVGRLLDELDRARGQTVGDGRALIRFVKDRPGHDLRYAIDFGRITTELGWRPRVGLDEGLRATVAWYLDHQGWCARALNQEQRRFEETWYASRLDAADPSPAKEGS